MLKDRTTYLDKILNGYPFTWGKAIKMHSIDEYHILEFNPFKTTLSGINPHNRKEVDLNKTEYFIWVNGKDMGQTYNTLDEAIIGCITFKYDGYSSPAGHYFFKMIKPEKV